MKRLITLIVLLAFVKLGTAQKNGLSILKTKDLVQTTSKKKSFKFSPSLQLSKKGNEKFPGTKAHYEWVEMVNDWVYANTSSISYNADGSIANEILQDEQQNVIGRINYTYNSNGMMTQALMEIQMSPNVFVPYMSTINEFNIQGDLTLSENRMWNNNAWEVLYGDRYDIEYNAMLGVKSTVECYWNGSKYDSSMRRVERYVNNVLSKEESYQFTGTEFVPIDQYEFIYDNSGVDTGMIKRLWDGTTWVDDQLYCNYIWDSPSKDFLTNTKIFLKVGASWRLYQRETFTHDVYDSFSYLLENYVSGDWEGNMRIQIVNNTSKARTLYLYDLYLNGTWEELFRIEEEYAYDNEGNETLHIYKESDSNGQLNNIYKDVYSDFITISGVSTTKNKALGFYPNPSSDFIKLKDEKMNGQKYFIIDLSGKTIQSDLINENLQIDLRKINAGIYLIKVGQHQSKIQIVK